MVSSAVEQVPGYPLETLPNIRDPKERARVGYSSPSRSR